MIEQKLRKIRFFKSLKTSLIGGCISIVIGFIPELAFSGISSALIQILLVSFFTGFTAPLILLSVNNSLQDNQGYRRLPFLIQMLSRIIVFIIIIILTFSASILIFTQDIRRVFENLSWAIIVGSIVAIGLFTLSTLREFLGKGFFINLLKGFYQNVRMEKAVIMFVDLKNSTRMGENLTPKTFFELLNEFLRNVEMCCTFFKGEIYKYLGDGAILVWHVSPSGLEGALDFIFGFRTEMKEKAGSLKTTYGVEIAYTAGAHSGTVLKGGLGSEKREMGLWGDTINTAARIQGACKQYDVDFLLSEDFVKNIEVMIPEKFKGLSLRSVGETVLRGKAGTHQLYTV